jgi:hypothetical protein
MTAKEVLAELRSMGNENVKRTFMRHGVKEPLDGVKIEDLKKIQKKIKKDHALSLELYRSGNADAMYLAGLIADEGRISPGDLQLWADNASGMLSEYTVPWIAADSGHGYALALKWIDAEKENLQTAGWSTLSNVVALTPDGELDLKKIRGLLKRVEKEIHAAGNRVRYVMNVFVISVGSHIRELTEEARKTGMAIGPVTVHMNGTACKVPYAPNYIQKVADKGRIGRKKKMARC